MLLHVSKDIRFLDNKDILQKSQVYYLGFVLLPSNSFLYNALDNTTASVMHF